MLHANTITCIDAQRGPLIPACRKKQRAASWHIRTATVRCSRPRLACRGLSGIELRSSSMETCPHEKLPGARTDSRSSGQPSNWHASHSCLGMCGSTRCRWPQECEPIGHRSQLLIGQRFAIKLGTAAAAAAFRLSMASNQSPKRDHKGGPDSLTFTSADA